MKESERFNEVLEECLKALAAGRPLESCLEKHPEQAEALRPLLEAALAARRASRLKPRPEFRERARLQFRSAVSKSAAPEKSRPFHFRFGFAGAVALALVVLISGVSTVAVAGNSMPDQPLYPVKIASEDTRVALAASPIKKATVLIRLTDYRIEEIVYLATKGEPRYVDMVAQRLGEHLDTIIALTAIRTNGRTSPPAGFAPGTPPPTVLPAPRSPENREQLKAFIQQRAEKNTAKLKETFNLAPPAVRPNLDRTIIRTSTGYQRALQNIERIAESDEKAPQSPPRNTRPGT